MATIWTHGVWTVKPGREEEFVAAWHELARETLTRFELKEKPHLLRDRERPNVYLSFGPWDSIETVERFRAGIAPHLERIGQLLESFEAFTLDEVPFDG